MPASEAQSTTSNLFQGARFWLSQNIPQRTRLKEMISQNGGIVVLFEKEADVKLVDHTRKNLPPDTTSYQYVERSVRNGRLEDLEQHRAGPSAPRPMGASHIPKKGTRTDYSLREDQIAYDYLYPYEQHEDAPISGTKIYQHLAQRFPQHSWQSWRSRYLKFLRGKPRPGGGTPRPELVHGNSRVEPLQKPQHVQNAPQSESSHTMYLRNARSADPNLKRKRDAEAQAPADPLIAVPYSPSSKRRIVEAPKDSASETLIADPGSASRPHGPPISYTHHPSHAIEQATERSNVIQPTQSQRTGTTQPQWTGTTQPQRTEPHHDTLDAIDPLFLEMPFPPSSPEPEEDVELPDVNGWIDSQLARGVADETTIISVLRSANMDLKLAGRVLEQWDPEKGIPDNLPGIWTAEDDACLEGPDARGIERVFVKHGRDAFDSRWDYLSMARERGQL